MKNGCLTFAFGSPGKRKRKGVGRLPAKNMDFIREIDQWILLFIQEYMRADFLDGFWKGITFLGEKGWFWIVLSVVLLCRKKTRRAGAASLLSLLGSFLITNLLLKNLIARPRPYQEMEALILLIKKPWDYSFPSGHTSASFASALACCQMLPKPYGAALIILAAMIAFSRLYLGAHYPTDIIGGFLTALAVSAFVCHEMRRHRILEQTS